MNKSKIIWGASIWIYLLFMSTVNADSVELISAREKYKKAESDIESTRVAQHQQILTDYQANLELG